MTFPEINDPKGLCKDVTGLGRWGNGDVEVGLNVARRTALRHGPRAPVLRAPDGRRRPAMIADLKPYPEYKESGLPWLGQVPEHWEVLAECGTSCARSRSAIDAGGADAVASRIRYGELFTTPRC